MSYYCVRCVRYCSCIQQPEKRKKKENEEGREERIEERRSEGVGKKRSYEGRRERRKEGEKGKRKETKRKETKRKETKRNRGNAITKLWLITMQIEKVVKRMIFSDILMYDK